MESDLSEIMDIILLIPANYDLIIEKTQGHEHPYTREELERKFAENTSRNNVGVVSIMKPGWQQSYQPKDLSNESIQGTKQGPGSDR